MDVHVQNILAQCTQRMYLIKLLKHQGMPQQQLAVIAHSIIVSRILYALLAWEGFLTVELKTESVFFKRSDYELFTKVCCGSHSLYHLLPPYRTSDLRLRGHPFQLPNYYTDLPKKSFIVRSLYEYIK